MAEAPQFQTLEFLQKLLAATQAELASSIAEATEAKQESDVFKACLEDARKLLCTARGELKEFDAQLREAWKEAAHFRTEAESYRREVNQYRQAAAEYKGGTPTGQDGSSLRLRNRARGGSSDSLGEGNWRNSVGEEMRLGTLRNRARGGSSESLGECNWGNIATGGSSEALAQGSLKLELALVNSTHTSLQKQLEDAQTKLMLVDAELAREKNIGVMIRSELLDAKAELEAYLSRLEESQLDNLTHFRYAELARTGRRNIDTVAMNHEYPCFWESLFFVLIYYWVACVMVLKYKDGFEALSEGSVHCNAIYFVAVMSSSVGYGDIFPHTDGAIKLTLWLIFFSGLNNIFTRVLFGHFWTFIRRSLPCSIKEGNRRVCVVVFALAAIFLSFCSGTIGARIDMMNDNKIPRSDIDRDAMNLSYITLTTVGFGNTSFKTMGGRIFATVWILISVPIFSWAASYLNELIFRALRFSWQEWVKPYLRNIVFPYIQNGLQTSAAAYVGSFFSPAIY